MTQQNISEKIVAAGTTITLVNGEQVSLKYGMGALAAIENNFGSVNKLAKLLSDTEESPIFSTLAYALWAGSSRKQSYEDFLELLDPRLITEYSEAFGEAFSQSLPTPQGKNPKA